MELRLARARNLLMQTDMSVIEVALACGFTSPSHFSKCYRALYKTTPYRERGVSQTPRPSQGSISAQPIGRRCHSGDRRGKSARKCAAAARSRGGATCSKTWNFNGGTRGLRLCRRHLPADVEPAYASGGWAAGGGPDGGGALRVSPRRHRQRRRLGMSGGWSDELQPLGHRGRHADLPREGRRSRTPTRATNSARCWSRRRPARTDRRRQDRRRRLRRRRADDRLADGHASISASSGRASTG